MFDRDHHQQLGQIKSRLFGYAYALTRDAEQAADLVQDCMVRAMSSRSVPREARAFRAWMFTILRNLWIDQMRSSRRERETCAEIEHSQADPPATPPEEVVVNRLAVRQAFLRLSKDHRDVLALVDIAGFSYEEAAEILRVPKGTIMSRVSRARSMLSQILGEMQVIPLSRARQGMRNG